MTLVRHDPGRRRLHALAVEALPQFIVTGHAIYAGVGGDIGSDLMPTRDRLAVDGDRKRCRLVGMLCFRGGIDINFIAVAVAGAAIGLGSQYSRATYQNELIGGRGGRVPNQDCHSQNATCDSGNREMFGCGDVSAHVRSCPARQRYGP